MTLTVDDASAEAVRLRVEPLFVANVDAVFNVAFRVLWNRADAEDVVQATFIKVFTRFDQLADEQRVRPWVLQVAYRESITVLRRRRDVPVDPSLVPELASTEAGPAERAVMSGIADELGRALQRLSADERLAVVLRDIEQLSMREVAEVLGVGLSAAKMRVHRGRQSLRPMLEKLELN